MSAVSGAVAGVPARRRAVHSGEGLTMGTTVEADEWGAWAAEQERLAEVEAELRERAADLGDAELARLGRRLLDRAGLAHGLGLEFRDRGGRVVRRVGVPARGG
jgi:hypothetical protein